MHNSLSPINPQRVFDDYVHQKSNGACLCQLSTAQWFSFDTLIYSGWYLQAVKLQDSQLATPVPVYTTTPTK
jgi:hypothetical protein